MVPDLEYARLQRSKSISLEHYARAELMTPAQPALLVAVADLQSKVPGLL